MDMSEDLRVGPASLSRDGGDERQAEVACPLPIWGEMFLSDL
jgi:hypothetical protein